MEREYVYEEFKDDQDVFAVKCWKGTQRRVNKAFVRSVENIIVIAYNKHLSQLF